MPSDLSSAERQAAQRRVEALYDEGKISETELRLVVAAIWQAENHADLVNLLVLDDAADSQPSYPAVPAANTADPQSATDRTSRDIAPRDSFDSAALQQAGRVPLPEEHALPRTVNVLSASERIGRWVIDGEHVAINVLGLTTIDLRHAAFHGKNIELKCCSVLGLLDIIVPPEMQVNVIGHSLVGLFGWHASLDATQIGNDPQLPTVTISGWAPFGGVRVRRLNYGVAYEAIWEDDDDDVEDDDFSASDLTHGVALALRILGD